MDKVYKSLQTVTFTKESMQMGNPLDMVNIIGPMEAILKEHLRMVWEMGKDYGKKVQEIVTNTKDSMQMIKKMAMVSLLGQVVMYIRAITNLIWEMDMVRCIGMMVVFIKVNGIKAYNMEKGRFMFQVKVIRKEYFKIMFWW